MGQLLKEMEMQETVRQVSVHYEEILELIKISKWPARIRMTTKNESS